MALEKSVNVGKDAVDFFVVEDWRDADLRLLHNNNTIEIVL